MGLEPGCDIYWSCDSCPSTFKFGAFLLISVFWTKPSPVPGLRHAKPRVVDLPCLGELPCRYGVRGLLFVHALAISAQVSGVSSEGFETTSAWEAWWLLPAALLNPPG